MSPARTVPAWGRRMVADIMAAVAAEDAWTARRRIEAAMADALCRGAGVRGIEVTLHAPGALCVSGADAAVIAARPVAVIAGMVLSDTATDRELPGERFDYYTTPPGGR